MTIAATSLPVLALAIAIITMASAFQAGFGTGLGLLAVPLLSLVAPSFVPGPMLVSALSLSFAMAWRERHALDRASVGLCIAGLLVGTVCGGIALAFIPREAFRTIFGVAILLAVLVSVIGAGVRMTPRALVTGAALGGFIGTMSGMHGPPMAVVLQNEEASRIRALLGAFFLVGASLSITAQAAVGLFGWESLLQGLLVTPGALLGSLIGVPIARVLNRQIMRAALLGVSAISALVLLFS
ncbi:hypothetical protein GCM10007301_49090 [Azorhizobium oxalatiphilum]|uniref:Probable membrane transporter protein n=1 Tax=Azorhizobium oxalatiphilum TaxID=980631 RepID=A0A917CBE4_9HYPH|nr:sulfite exporter TauE/SafE family protein [Azorhizobium oxalatiphilum]GGF83175.1 hypothetical protein GCM10007301_49090 [Azorhizobium oxalatiphilum]